MLVLSEQIKRANWTRLGRFEADRNLWETARGTSEMGQKAKYSPRADVFRFASNNGHRQTGPTGPFSAKKRHSRLDIETPDGDATMALSKRKQRALRRKI